LIEESKLKLGPPCDLYYPDSFRYTILGKRDCCACTWSSETNSPIAALSGDRPLCGECGFGGAHYSATTASPHIGWFALFDDNLNRRDFFGNTPLHFLAASGKAELSTIITMIINGADMRAKNTHGMTFMHVLRLSGHRIDSILNLLDMLKKQNFDFEQRSYTGVSVVHAFFGLSASSWLHYSHYYMKHFMSTLKPDLDTADNQGRTIQRQIIAWRDYYRQKCPRGWGDRAGTLGNIVAVFNKQKPTEPATQVSEFSLELSVLDLENVTLPGIMKSSAIINWVDKNGDTVLCALLKTVDDCFDEAILKCLVSELLTAGAEIHMRDRQSDTALGIAARRGFRLTVMTLLKHGANVHARDVNGKGILSQTRRKLWEARKEGNDKQYAKILSCIIALVDAGAKDKPTEREEWMTPEARAIVEEEKDAAA
jgi:hypothetical protein